MPRGAYFTVTTNIKKTGAFCLPECAVAYFTYKGAPLKKLERIEAYKIMCSQWESTRKQVIPAPSPAMVRMVPRNEWFPRHCLARMTENDEIEKAKKEYMQLIAGQRETTKKIKGKFF